MRYFLNTSAARPVGGFQFELVSLRGGSWLGVLAVADAAASTLVGQPNTEEISAEKYEEVKKNAGATPITSHSPQAPHPPPSPHLAIAEAVGRPIAQPIANPIVPVTPVTLFTTRNAPPVEQLLAPGHRMSRLK